MIKEVAADELLQCAKVIVEGIETVAREFDITRENEPRFTAFSAA